jgi:hypothetical protein
VAIRSIALALFALVLATALFGPNSPTRNFATVFVWVIWWVGFALFTALAVDLWSTGNPFRMVVDLVLRIARRRPRDCDLPVATGWLAVAGLLFISWLELVSDWSENPTTVALLIGLYTAGLLLGSAAFGTRAWFDAADPLSRLFRILGNLAPLAGRPDGLRLRLPGSGLVGQEASAAGAVFIVTLIAIVLFDGLSATPLWAGILEWATQSLVLRPWLLALRGQGVDILQLIQSAGFAATLAVAVLLYLGLSLAVWRAGGRAAGPGQVFAGFAASLLPIAVAYHLAHYASFLALAGQLLVPIASDPFGLGWNLFGGANQRIDPGAISAGDVWWISVVALVTGHALSVFVAHAEALRLFPDRRMAIRSQLPMMVFMVGLTSLSLWILAQPIVA